MIFNPFLAFFNRFFCDFGKFPTLRQVCQIKKKTSQDIDNTLPKVAKKKFIFWQIAKIDEMAYFGILEELSVG